MNNPAQKLPACHETADRLLVPHKVPAHKVSAHKTSALMSLAVAACARTASWRTALCGAVVAMFPLHITTPHAMSQEMAFAAAQPTSGEPTAAQESQPADRDEPGLTNTIRVDGAILKTIESTTLASPLAGVLLELTAKEGDVVVAGQRLGKLKDDAIRLELEQLKTQVEMARKKQANDIDKRLAEKTKQVADTEYQRAVSANARVPGTNPINEIDRLRLVADQSQLEIERAVHAQEMAAFDLAVAATEYRKSYELYERHRIEAPAGGVVVSVLKRKGEWVEPGTELLEIVRIDTLRVEGFISASQAMQDLVGRQATIRIRAPRLASRDENQAAIAQDLIMDSTGQQPFVGRVSFVSPDVNPANSQVRVFIDVENNQRRLRPGLQVEAFIAGPNE